MSAKPSTNNNVDTIDTVEDRPNRQQGRRPWLTILFHPDPDRIGENLELFEKKEARPVAISRLDPLFSSPDKTSEPRPLDTPFLSRKPFWLAQAPHGAVRLSPEDCGSRIRADGVDIASPSNFSTERLEQGVVIELGQRVVLLLHYRDEVNRCPQRLGMVGDSDIMEKLRNTLLKISSHEAPVLLEGESGVGKELSARAIHLSGSRKNAPFVAINLAAVPTSTAASELFGHLPGAFTGATTAHRGFFQQAKGGSLFLDEIGSTSLELQAMLLRVIESGEIQPVGAGSTTKVNVRVLVATDEDLGKAMDEGRFRAPLYHRLSASRVRVPALRKRRDDIGRLFFHFLRQELQSAGLIEKLSKDDGSSWLPARLLAQIARYDWPGNVRELHNLVRQLLINFGDAPKIDDSELMSQYKKETDAPKPEIVRQRPVEISDEQLLEVMRKNLFSIRKSAQELGISRSSLYTLIERSSLVRKARDIDGEELQDCFEQHKGNLDSMAKQLEVSRRALLLRLKELGLG